MSDCIAAAKRREWGMFAGAFCFAPRVSAIAPCAERLGEGLFCRDYSMRTNLSRSTVRGLSLTLGAAFLIATAAPSLHAQADDGAKYAALIKEAKTQTGLIKVHQKDGKVYLELAGG